MKIALEHLDLRAFALDLAGSRDERLTVREAISVRGVLEQAADRLAIADATAARITLDALRVYLGSVLLSSGEANLEGLTLSFERRTDHLGITAGAGSLAADDLQIVAGSVTVRGKVTFVGARLTVANGEGSLTADQVNLSAFTLRIGETTAACDLATGRSVEIRWGAAGFAMTAAALDAPALEVVSGDTRVAMSGVHLDGFSLDRREIRADRATAEGGRVALAFHPPKRSSSLPPSSGSTKVDARSEARDGGPIFDWHALDGLSGEIAVDVEVDASVPILGRRHAIHRLRVPIAHGALDYRALESNLSALENALFDFSLREHALVFERVNPLFPTRGHGKPVVVWDLDAADLALAEHKQVRLAVLPRGRLADAGKEPEPEEEAIAKGREPTRKGGVALRRLAFHGIDVRLALAEPSAPLAGHFRPHRFDAFVMQGNVVHSAEEPGETGAIVSEIRGLSGAITDLPLGQSRLDIARVGVSSLAPIDLTFRDVHATEAQIGVAELVLGGVTLRLVDSASSD